MAFSLFTEILTKHKLSLGETKNTIKGYAIIFSLLSVYPYICASKFRNKILPNQSPDGNSLIVYYST